MTAPDSAEATASAVPAGDASTPDASAPAGPTAEASVPEATAPAGSAADASGPAGSTVALPEADVSAAVETDAAPESGADDEAAAIFAPDTTPDTAPEAQWAEGASGGTPLTWVDAVEIARHPATEALDDTPPAASGGALLTGAHLRPAITRPGVLVPLGVLVGLLGTYVGSAMLWPLHEVAPAVQAVELTTIAAPAAAITWPAQGSAAVGIGGIGTTSSSLDAAAIASVTKVVSSLMVLDRMPLAVGEQGPEFSFTRADNLAYWDYRRSDQSALDVPVGGTLTEFQLLQGTLLGSANNYIDRLSQEIWGSPSAFTAAAEVWLRDRGLDDITIVTPSGFDDRNRATPESLVALAELAMQNPVFAGIVGTPSVDLPGAGTVVNTNGMLADPGVVGVKTGTLGDSWNLLTAKVITLDDTTVRLYASVLGQADDAQRLTETRSLFAQVETALEQLPPAVAAGTVVGTVTTPWGATTDVVTDADADVVLWNGATAQASTDFSLGDNRESGDEVGTMTSAGPLNTVTTSLSLADDVDAPSPWWRLTHPLELLGITAAQR
ncbi:D-alanyl-D-alanine carboxypeptidase family protein [Microbacterium foliorum]|uniref:D-alanyl-D-alanine carboxypeptidase family protein n=1 Tax=Microbacterium foliorum TaxID=104336 RepID=UPI0021592FA5|nr:D-alanyl-D-alanine carboxypeptidase [Microbacterium foliorum]